MGPIYGNFISWWQLVILIPQPDRMLTELKKVNQADGYLLRQRTVWLMVIIIKVSNVVFSLCMSGCLPKVQYTAKSLIHCSPSKHFPQATITCRLVIPLHNTAYRQSVPSQILFSITCGFVASY